VNFCLANGGIVVPARQAARPPALSVLKGVPGARDCGRSGARGTPGRRQYPLHNAAGSHTCRAVVSCRSG
jgi:hypothetical protein